MTEVLVSSKEFRQYNVLAMDLSSSGNHSNSGDGGGGGRTRTSTAELSTKCMKQELGQAPDRVLSVKLMHQDRQGKGERQQSLKNDRISVSSQSQDSYVDQASVLALVLSAVRRSGITCHSPPEDIKMDIGWPTDVQHIAHVTFDRFNGFLGLPVEFEVEVPIKAPSASASVFGVSPESMQCCYDRHGNSVPTILLLLQEKLYAQDGLKAEGIFRINPENSKEVHVRDQLNKGIVPDDIDVHCLASLIKAWLRELPRGVLDAIPPDQLLQCNSDEQRVALVKMLPPTEAALLNWVVNLMADVVSEEHLNKMNAHNVAMVFAPNMTQMADPLTALMHAVQVMNFLKTLILRTLQDRQNNSRQDGSTTGNIDRNGTSRKKSMEQEKFALDVEERFLRGFSGRGIPDDSIMDTRFVQVQHSCL